ncbi:MAG: membrane dipeptidase [Firmicutes bacterium]|nr:membrane dipeptidase [Bacillota bacterium]
MKIVDMHCDTLMKGWNVPGKMLYDADDFSINLKLLKENNSLVQFFAMYLRRDIDGNLRDINEAYEILDGMHKYYTQQMEINKHIIKPAYCVEDILKNKEEGLISSILTIEDGTFVDGNLDNINKVYDMGVRLITLLWGFENSMGYPCEEDPILNAKGLKPFGIEAIERMNELGIMVDVSHTSDGGFYDVAKHSKKPFVASHSCAKALCKAPRNLTDDQLKVLGENGGVAGINFECSFLKDDSTHATYDQVMQHLVHMKNKAGIEAIGFGSDFDGIDDNGEMVDYSGFGRMLLELEKHFTPREIDMICSENALRVMKDIFGK